MKRKVLFVLCLLLGLLFINAGLDKFFHYMPIPEDLPEPMVNMSMSMMEVSWLMPLVGFFEIVGGLLLIIPRFRALGAVVICPILDGIFLQPFHLARSSITMHLLIIT